MSGAINKIRSVHTVAGYSPIKRADIRHNVGEPGERAEGKEPHTNGHVLCDPFARNIQNRQIGKDRNQGPVEG